GFDAVVHLAGEPILGRWTTGKKRRITDSRVQGTRLLAAALAALSVPPRVLVCASGADYYRAGDEPQTEASPPGQGFLAELCQAWEAAAEPARRAGIRTVHVRTGLALAGQGGVLKAMLLPFRLGLGGPIGTGRQYWSWIALDDLVAVYRFALSRESLDGAVNAAAPNPVTNAEFAGTLGRVLHRPTVLPVPSLALRLVFGREAAEEAMLSGTRLVPARLLEVGFTFRYPELEPALRHVLGVQ
ncbi:MAG TPA: TIGR01777 family oxidoreductase, partial [Gemmatimonadales bacterium]